MAGSRLAAPALCRLRASCFEPRTTLYIQTCHPNYPNHKHFKVEQFPFTVPWLHVTRQLPTSAFRARSTRTQEHNNDERP
eukprot:scaffold7422_cov134-Isochrysis_galbana.AAC.8